MCVCQQQHHRLSSNLTFDLCSYHQVDFSNLAEQFFVFFLKKVHESQYFPGFPFFFFFSRGSQQTDQALPLLDLLLNLITGRGNLSLRGQHGAQEARQRTSYGGVESPAKWALSRPEGQGLGPAIAHHLLWTPASGVQHEAHHQQQACREEHTEGWWGISHCNSNIWAESTNAPQGSCKRSDSSLVR